MTVRGFACPHCKGALGVYRTRRPCAGRVVRYRQCRACRYRTVTVETVRPKPLRGSQG